MDEIKKYVEAVASDCEIVDEMKSAGRNYINHHNRINLLKPHLLHKLAVFLNPLMRSLRKLDPPEKKGVHDFAKSLIDIDNVNQVNLVNHQPARITARRSSFVDDFIETEASELDSEFERYLNLTFSKNDYENLILEDWWKNNKGFFPNLYKLFLRVQSTTATSAPAERSFSKTGHILSDVRNKTDPDFVSDLLIVNQFKNSISYEK